MNDKNESLEAPVEVTTLPLPTPSSEEYIYPPSILQQIKQLFQKDTVFPALIIPAKLTTHFKNKLSSHTLNRPRMRNIYPVLESEVCHHQSGIDFRSERKLILEHVVNNSCDQDNDKQTITVSSNNSDNSPLQTINNFASLFDDPIFTDIFSQYHDNQVRKATHLITTTYDDFTVDQVLKRVLPTSVINNESTPTSFEVIGHVAHLNLRDEHIPYQYIIGQVILDKHVNIHVVVNKVGNITNEYRTFPMAIIAYRKEKNDLWDEAYRKDIQLGHICKELKVQVREDGCLFHLDFCKVYWNSRLQYEHRRIVQLIGGRRDTQNKKRKRIQVDGTKSNNNSNEKQIIVADACAGIGPFAIPLASHYPHIKVYANDLNPTSYEYLNINSTANKCSSARLSTYNMDARAFLRHLDDVEHVKYDHVLMNLPAIAPEFLNVFRGWKRDDGSLPMIHVYCFGGKDEMAEVNVVERCSKALGCHLKDNISVHVVRDVSPQKNMFCVSFKLPVGVKDVERVMTFDTLQAKLDEE